MRIRALPAATPDLFVRRTDIARAAGLQIDQIEHVAHILSDLPEALFTFCQRLLHAFTLHHLAFQGCRVTPRLVVQQQILVAQPKLRRKSHRKVLILLAETLGSQSALEPGPAVGPLRRPHGHNEACWLRARGDYLARAATGNNLAEYPKGRQ